MSMGLEILNEPTGAVFAPRELPTIPPSGQSCSVSLPFAAVSQFLSDRPLRHPRTMLETPPNAALQKLAEKFPPPQSWFEWDEESPF